MRSRAVNFPFGVLGFDALFSPPSCTLFPVDVDSSFLLSCMVVLFVCCFCG